MDSGLRIGTPRDTDQKVRGSSPFGRATLSRQDSRSSWSMWRVGVTVGSPWPRTVGACFAPRRWADPRRLGSLAWLGGRVAWLLWGVGAVAPTLALELAAQLGGGVEDQAGGGRGRAVLGLG